MDALLEKLSAGQIIALVSIVCGSIVAIVMILAITKYQFQFLADDTALKRERQQADLALRERLLEKHGTDLGAVEQILATGFFEEPHDEQNTELAKRFGRLDAPADEIEHTLGQAMAADPANKSMIINVMDELLDYDAEPDAILAAVRPLCTNKARKKENTSASACSEC